MDSPPIFDYSRHDMWMAKMISHLKTLGHLVFQATTQESYPNNSKHKKANALALKTLRASLNEDLLHVFVLAQGYNHPCLVCFDDYKTY